MGDHKTDQQERPRVQRGEEGEHGEKKKDTSRGRRLGRIFSLRHAKVTEGGGGKSVGRFHTSGAGLQKGAVPSKPWWKSSLFR